MINTIIVTAYLLGVIYFAFTEGKSDAFKISKNIPIDHVDAWIKRALTCLGMFGLAGVAIHPMTFRTFLLLPMAAFLFSAVFRSSLNDARGKVWFYMGAYIPMRTGKDSWYDGAFHWIAWAFTGFTIITGPKGDRYSTYPERLPAILAYTFEVLTFTALLTLS